MIPRLQAIVQNIRGSLWAVPLAMIAFAVALAILALNIDLEPGRNPAWYLYSGDADDAPQFLSHLVTSMITMATLAITITMVVLTLAAQQLGPRLIQSFMRDRFVQASLGFFVATVVYLLLILRHTHGLESRTPNLAVSFGTMLVFVSIVAMLMYLHHLARSIISDNVVQKVGAMLDAEAARLLPDERAAPQTGVEPSVRRQGLPIQAPCGGYIQAVDFDALLRLASAADCVVELAVRAGHHVIAGSTIGWVSPPSTGDDLRRKIAGCVLIGPERTAVQDLEFSIRQLVEIAVRALSPGINDPYTAMAVIDRLGVSLGLMLRRGEAPRVWLDEHARLRIVAPVSSFEGIVDVAFNQIRQRAAQSPDVLIRLAENLAELIAIADSDRQEPLARQLQLVLAAGRRNIEDEADLHALEERVAPTQAILDGQDKRAGR